MSLAPADLRGVRVCWLLSVDALGREWRWSSEPVDVTDAASGRSYAYAGGLPRIEVLVVADPGTSVADPQPVTIEIPWPDVVDLLERGHALRGSAELAWWPMGADYRQREVLTTGRIVVSSWGGPGEPVTITITPDALEERDEWPRPDYVADGASWPTIPGGANPGGVHPDDVGLVYPSVAGSPGQQGVTDSASAIYGGLVQYPGSPALRVQTDLTVSAGGDRLFTTRTLLLTYGRVEAPSVSIMYPATGGALWLAETVTVTNTTDALGRPCVTADVTGVSAGTAITQAEALYVAWATSFTTRRRAIIGDDGDTITGAGGWIDYLMRRSSVPYDSAAWLGVRSYLDAWAVDVYLDEPVGPWTWLAEQLLPGLPVSALPGPAGVRPVLWRPDCRRDEAVDHLRVGHDCARASSVTLRAEGEPAVGVDFAQDADTGETRDAATIQPEADVDAAVGATVWARAARDLLGATGDQSASAWWTSERGTAYAIAAWRTALAAGWLELDVDVDQDRGWLALGAIVLVTDTDVGLDARPAQVGGITYRDDGTLTLRLVVWRNPAASSSSVPLADDPDPPQGD